MVLVGYRHRAGDPSRHPRPRKHTRGSDGEVSRGVGEGEGARCLEEQRAPLNSTSSSETQNLDPIFVTKVSRFTLDVSKFREGAAGHRVQFGVIKCAIFGC